MGTCWPKTGPLHGISKFVVSHIALTKAMFFDPNGKPKKTDNGAPNHNTNRTQKTHKQKAGRRLPAGKFDPAETMRSGMDRPSKWRKFL